MKRILAQSQKEILQFLRDRLTVALAFVLPLMTLLIFGFAIRLEEKDIPIAVQDYDNSPLSRGLTERLFATDQLEPVSYNNPNIVRSTVDSGSAQAAVIIPPEFSRKFRAGQTASLQVLINGTDVNNARVIKNSIVAVTGFYQNTLNYGSHIQPITADIRLWFNPGRKESLYVVPGTIGIILWIYPSLLATLALAREKEQGTILQAYASSITAFELLAGKVLAYLVIGLTIATLVVIVCMLLFNLRFAGDPTPFLVGTFIYVLDSVIFGTLIATRVNTQSAAVQTLAFAGFIASLLLSGFLYPLRNIKFPFNYVSYVVPPRYYMVLVRDSFVRGSGWPGVWYHVVILMVFAVAYFSICRKRMSRMQLES